MSLTDWVNNGWLVQHPPDQKEIADLMAAVERDLKDSQTPGLSPDWRFNIAYNAALQAATAALFARGFRATRDQHHFRVIQSLSLTLPTKPEIVTLFDFFRKKRNVGVYERPGAISNSEAEEMRKLAVELRDQVLESLKTITVS